MHTIYDIAKATQVSPATVSRVVNGRPGVNEATMKKVKRAMEKANFQPRWKAVDKSRFLVMVPSHEEALSDPYIGRILTGVADACFAQNFALVVRPFPSELRSGRELRELVVNDGASGVILLSLQEGYSLADMIGMEQIPHVVIGYKEYNDGRNQILLNDFEGARKATRHLLDMGHRDIAMLSFNHRDNGHYERYRGYVSALEKSGSKSGPNCVEVDSVNSTDTAEATSRLFETTSPPSALIITGQLLAHGVLMELERRKVRIPQECSVVIFQDAPNFDYLPIPLSCVRVPGRRMGMAAVRQLDDAIGIAAGKKIESRVTRFEMELVLRESTAPFKS